MKRLWFLLLLFACPRLHSQTTPWTGIVATSRAIDWSTAGVTGGIPTNRTQCVTSACATVTTNGASSTQAQIEAAWTSAPANTYVLLPAGSYSLPCLNLSGVSNVTLRGAGANQTLIATTSSCGGASVNLTSSDGNSNAGPNNGPVAVSGTVAQGSNLITLASVPNLKIGNPIVLQQLNSQCDNGGVLVIQTGSSYSCTPTSPGLGGPYSEDGGANGDYCPDGSSTPNCYSQQQTAFVTSCNDVTTVGTACSGTSVSVVFNPPLHMSNWSTSDKMVATWGTSPIQYAGIEDLRVDSTGSPGADGVHLNNCSNCWVKGIASYTTNLSHVVVQNDSANDTVDNSYFFLTQAASTGSYGVNCSGASNLLIENNIFHAVVSPVVWNGSCNGSVVGYNYNINNYYESSGYNENFYGEHSAGVDTNLVEGNISNVVDADNIHGTANLGTFFRNVITGPLPDCWASGTPATYTSSTYVACNGGTTAVQLYAFHRFYNFIGNIVGTTGVNTVYNSGTATNTNAFGIGYGNTVANDPNVQATIMLWGNADSATGFAAPRFDCSEVPTALTGVQAPYTNPCPGSHTLPPSFYYSSRPAWWPSAKPWPIIGPDINGGNIEICSSGTYARALVSSVSMCSGGTGSTGMDGLANSNPAMDCYLSLGGLPSGRGGALANFNESSCYVATVSSNLPQPPTNLTATVQ
jgi:hypothetical protein